VISARWILCSIAISSHPKGGAGRGRERAAKQRARARPFHIHTLNPGRCCVSTGKRCNRSRIHAQNANKPKRGFCMVGSEREGLRQKVLQQRRNARCRWRMPGLNGRRLRVNACLGREISSQIVRHNRLLCRRFSIMLRERAGEGRRVLAVCSRVLVLVLFGKTESGAAAN
jgi:hypothetical protein